jgi:hypothetical protein
MFDETYLNIFIAVLLLILGLSFAYKCYLAVFAGKVWIWPGFFPITLISPVFTHLHPNEKSFVKVVQAPWVHVVWGPFFFLASLALLAWGADRLDLPGTQSINMVLTLGKPDAPKAIYYDPASHSYKFPFVTRIGTKAFNMLTHPMEIDKKQQLQGVDYSTAPSEE